MLRQALSPICKTSAPPISTQALLLSIFKSMRLFPVIWYTFVYVLKNKTWSYSVAQMGFKVTLKPHMPQACSILPASFSQVLVIGVGHHMWLAFAYIFFVCFIFLVFFSFLLSSIYFYFLCTCYFFTYKA